MDGCNADGIGDTAARIKDLEKTIRVLRKQLQRSEFNRLELEEINERKEALLRKVITDLQESEQTLAQKSCDLEQAFTEISTMQAKLIESEKMSALGTLVAGIAHEINNPVNFIHGNLEYAEHYMKKLMWLVRLYQKHYPEPNTEIQSKIQEIDLDFIIKDLTKLLRSMQMGTDRIYEIVKSLRSFSRLDETKCKQVDIHEGIDSTLLILQHRLKFHPAFSEIQIIRDYGQIPQIECYPGPLNQVFMNLLSNAIDAIEEKFQTNPHWADPPQICIRTATTEKEISIHIRDSGLGIPEKIRSQIFNPFYTTKAVGKGTGLGLSISYQIVVERHRGSLECNSQLGQGTEFKVIVPIEQPSAPCAL